MKIAGLVQKAQNFTRDNSPTILTAVGVTGAVTAAILTGKATVKATRLIDAVELRGLHYPDPDKLLDRKERFKLVWKLYIPAAGVLTLTCVSIVCANRIGMRRTAAVASAFALTERAFDEYKETVVDQIGKTKEKVVRDEAAKKSVQRTADREGWPVIITTGKVLCHDEYTNQFFHATINQVDAAVNEVNREIATSISGAVCVSDFYDFIGEGGPHHTSLTDEMGWNDGEHLTIKWTTVPGPTPESPAAHSYEFESRPKLRPWADASFR
jgi:hypothetical protein